MSESAVSRVSCHPAVIEINEEAVESSIHAAVGLQILRNRPNTHHHRTTQRYTASISETYPKMKFFTLYKIFEIFHMYKIFEIFHMAHVQQEVASFDIP